MKNRVFVLVLFIGVFAVFSTASAVFEWQGGQKAFEAYKEFFDVPSTTFTNVRFKSVNAGVVSTDLKIGSFVGDGSAVVEARGNYCENFGNCGGPSLKTNFNLIDTCKYDGGDNNNTYNECVYE